MAGENQARGRTVVTVLSIAAAIVLFCGYLLSGLISIPIGLLASGLGPACKSGAVSASSTLSVNGAPQLPGATISYLDDRKVKERAQQNMERYTYAQEKTGVPWQVVAALHYREAGMRSNASILDGEPILGYEYRSVDGQTIGANPNDDAVNAANALKRLADGVYDVDVTKSDLAIGDWGKAFLSYNRGYLFKRAGVEYTLSPYVMNGLDESHMDMQWSSADTVSGSDGNKAGALAVLVYLGGAIGSGQCASGGAVAPVQGDHLEISDLFGAPRDNGHTHGGLDIVGGSVIQATMPGKVTVAQDNFYDYGTAVEIDHGNGIRTRYGHMVEGSLLVHVGDTVTAGQALGTMGSTGRSTGVHLHFEVTLQDGDNWTRVDPEKWLADHGIKIPRQ